MIDFNRREFLKALAATAALGVAGRGAFHLAPSQDRPFEFLVVGDSLIWGQGLEEKDKFYSLTADWLRREAFGKTREVNLKVKAHSGATIKFDPKEAEKYRKAGRDEAFFYKPEVNIGFPSMWKQVEVAAGEYKAAGVTGGADLIMVTAGITDISVEGVLDPFGDNKKLVGLIETTCRDRVSELLEHTAAHHPNALIALVGYFPMLSPSSSGKKVFNAWLETLDVPGFLQPLANNPVMRKLVFNKIRRAGIRRSRIWLEESNRNFQRAVDAANAKAGRRRAIFIRSPLTEDQAAEAPNTLLFRMKANGDVEDPLFEERRRDCRTSLAELKKTTGIKYSAERCARAAVGHPDPNGSRAYAEAIRAALAALVK